MNFPSHEPARRGHKFDILVELTRKEISLRYKNSYLGYAWSILNPLVLACVFFLAFRVIMRVQIENYALFLLSGLFPWQWFANSLQASAQVYISNAQIVKKIRFHWEFLPLAVVLNDGFHMLATLPIIAVLVLIYGHWPSVAWLYGVPILLLAQAAIVYGFSLIAAALNVFFRDIERLVGILVLILFYLTPIIYRMDMVPERYRMLFLLNPMGPLIGAYRSLFMYGTLEWSAVGQSLISGAALLTVGFAVHRRLQWRFGEAI